MPKDKYVVGLKWLVVYQIAGGLLGIAFVIPLLLRTNVFNLVSALLISGGFLLQAFSVYCGVMLHRSQENSLVMSFVCQCLQAVSLYGFGFLYQFVSGFSFSLYLESFSGSFHVQVGTSLSRFSILAGGNLFDRMIGFNFVALGIVTVLYYEIKAIAREKKNELVDSIGN